MYIGDVFISRRIADKIWEEHGVSADEAVDLLYGDPMIRRARGGRYMAVGLAAGGYLTVIFEYQRGVAEIVTAYAASDWQVRLFKKSKPKKRVMVESQMFEYNPDDIGDEDVILEWEPRPAGEQPLCPRDGRSMTEEQQTYTLAGGRFIVTYEVWVCSECGEVFLDRQQARRFGAIQMLDRLLKERKALPKGQVLSDGEELFVNLSLMQELAALWRQTVGV